MDCWICNIKIRNENYIVSETTPLGFGPNTQLRSHTKCLVGVGEMCDNRYCDICPNYDKCPLDEQE